MLVRPTASPFCIARRILPPWMTAVAAYEDVATTQITLPAEFQSTTRKGARVSAARRRKGGRQGQAADHPNTTRAVAAAVAAAAAMGRRGN